MPFFLDDDEQRQQNKKGGCFSCVLFHLWGGLLCLFPPFFLFHLFFVHKTQFFFRTKIHRLRHFLDTRDDERRALPLFLSFSLSFGVPFLSRSRARGAKNARARALNRTRRAGYSLAPVVGASELARSWGNRHRVLFARIQKREFCWFPVALVVGEKKGRKVSVTARSRARALLSRTDYLSIHRSIDRLEKKSKNGRVCARAAFWSRVAARRR